MILTNWILWNLEELTIECWCCIHMCRYCKVFLNRVCALNVVLKMWCAVILHRCRWSVGCCVMSIIGAGRWSNYGEQWWTHLLYGVVKFNCTYCLTVQMFHVCLILCIRFLCRVVFMAIVRSKWFSNCWSFINNDLYNSR